MGIAPGVDAFSATGAQRRFASIERDAGTRLASGLRGTKFSASAAVRGIGLGIDAKAEASGRTGGRTGQGTKAFFTKFAGLARDAAVSAMTAIGLEVDAEGVAGRVARRTRADAVLTGLGPITDKPASPAVFGIGSQIKASPKASGSRRFRTAKGTEAPGAVFAIFAHLPTRAAVERRGLQIDTGAVAKSLPLGASTRSRRTDLPAQARLIASPAVFDGSHHVVAAAPARRRRFWRADIDAEAV